MIKINFEFQTIHGRYCDALHLPDDHTFTDEEIQAMKQARVDKWFAFITTPPQGENELNAETSIIDEVA